MNSDKRRRYIDDIIETLRSQELNATSHQTISDFDKMRLLSSVGLLIHDGLTTSAEATNKLTKALEQASCDLQAASSASGKAARTLNHFTFVVAGATLFLVMTGIYQGFQAKRQADIAEKQFQSAARSGPTPPTAPGTSGKK